jgi:hypothetical protein
MRWFETRGPVYPEDNYVVFDHRNTPEPRVETEIIDGLTIRSYVISVIQERRPE